MRKHYAELRTGVREGLPTDLARPLSVGQRVIALHPKTREVHDGSVLTVDHDKCRVQFDRPDIGVEFVMVGVLLTCLHVILSILYSCSQCGNIFVSLIFVKVHIDTLAPIFTHQILAYLIFSEFNSYQC